jgi:hypothetical protein
MKKRFNRPTIHGHLTTIVPMQLSCTTMRHPASIPYLCMQASSSSQGATTKTLSLALFWERRQVGNGPRFAKLTCVPCVGFVFCLLTHTVSLSSLFPSLAFNRLRPSAKTCPGQQHRSYARIARHNREHPQTLVPGPERGKDMGA